MGAAGWGGYQNGEIPLAAMVRTEEGQYLQANAHEAWGNLVRACAGATGIWIKISEGYRDLATQWYYWNLYQAGTGNVAAYPGNSNHGRGVAVDIIDVGSVFDWLRANAGNYGWSWATGQASGERWHWEYVGPLTAPNPSTPANTTTSEEDEMTVYRAQNSSKDGLIKGGYQYKQVGDGHIVEVSNLESIFTSNVKEIGGDDLRVLSYTFGLAESEKPAAGQTFSKGNYMGPGKLTGRVFYAGTTPVLPLAGATAATVTEAQIVAIAKAVAASITVPTPPSAAAVAKAVNDDAANRLKA